MSDFNDFKGKAGTIVSKAAGAAKNLASAAATKTKQVSRIAKLNMDIVSQKETIKKAYSELGKLYYENHHDAPEGLLLQSCQEIDVAKAAIADMEEEIAQLKAGAADEIQDADFETVVDETEADIEVEIIEEPDEPAEAEVTVVVEESAPEADAVVTAEDPAPEEPAPETFEAAEPAPIEPALEETPTEPVSEDVSPDDETAPAEFWQGDTSSYDGI